MFLADPSMRWRWGLRWRKHADHDELHGYGFSNGRVDGSDENAGNSHGCGSTLRRQETCWRGEVDAAWVQTPRAAVRGITRLRVIRREGFAPRHFRLAGSLRWGTPCIMGTRREAISLKRLSRSELAPGGRRCGLQQGLSPSHRCIRSVRPVRSYHQR